MFDDVSLSYMLATAVIFLAVMIILNALLYKPLLTFMDERTTSIDNDEKKVKDNFEELSHFNEELDAIKQNMRDEIAMIKQKAINEARNSAEETIKNKKLELEQKMQSFYTQLSKEREDLERELRSRLPLWQEALKKKLKHI